MSATPPRRRRTRLGSSQSVSGWSPSPQASSRPEDTADVDEWIDVLVRALRDEVEMQRDRLGQLAGCKYWGPGAFRRALSEAVDRGVIRKTARNRYAAVE